MTPLDKISFVRGHVTWITGIQKVLLLTIATHLGNNDYCYVSFSTLQKECCITRANLNLNLKILVDQELIIKIPPSDEFKSNRYKINFEKIASTAGIPLPVDNSNKLVSQQYQSSIAPILDQYRTDTRVVSQRYPKRNINKKENKTKDTKSFFSPVDNSKPAPERTLTSRETGRRHIQEIMKQNGLNYLIKKGKENEPQ